MGSGFSDTACLTAVLRRKGDAMRCNTMQYDAMLCDGGGTHRIYIVYKEVYEKECGGE